MSETQKKIFELLEEKKKSREIIKDFEHELKCLVHKYNVKIECAEFNIRGRTYNWNN
jgi:hypothetical protein